MATVKFDLPDDQAAELTSKATAQGLSLEEWYCKLADAATAQESSVLEQMRRLRSRVKPDPEGWSTRDYVVHGRR